MNVEDTRPPKKTNTTKIACEESHLFFSRWFFKERQAIKFKVNWHHRLLCAALERVMAGEIKNIVINVPPGSSKTELAVINFIARGLALNPWARFLHISSGDDLVLLNSQTARDMILSDEFQKHWPLKIADDAKAKKRWNVMLDGRKAGGVYAVSLGGQITGFRAGHMATGFQGAIIIDDPLKADDIFSKVKTEDANRKLLSTVKSRKASPSTPTIVIMQRLGVNDPTGFIKEGNLPGEWVHLVIPALIDDAYVSGLPKELQKEVDRSERDARGRYSYWPYKEPLQDLLAMEGGTGIEKNGNRINRFVFNGQYQQNPTALGGNLIHGAWFPRYKILSKILWRVMIGDTAQKTAERNDFSVFQIWGMGEDGKIYLLDMIRGKWEAPDLKRVCVDFWNKHNAMTAFGKLRQLIIEDKASGTGLIQDIKRENKIPVVGVERNKDKLTRLMDVVSYIEAGYVCLPEDASWVSEFIAECEAFTSDDSHAHDDQLDPMFDAIVKMLVKAFNGFFSGPPIKKV